MIHKREDRLTKKDISNQLDQHDGKQGYDNIFEQASNDSSSSQMMPIGRSAGGPDVMTEADR